MQRLTRRAESPLVFWLCMAVLAAAGVTSNLLDRQSTSEQTRTLAESGIALTSLAQASYYMLALWLLTSLTPRWLGRLRPAVQIDDAAFARHARRIAGGRSRALFALLPPVVALAWLLALLERLVRADASSGLALDYLTYAPLPAVSVLISAAAVWRMVGLARLAREPLAITLFDVSRATPIGHISSAYSALIIGGELLHQAMLGSPNSTVLVIAGLATLASLVALLLPLWAVHRQMVALKAELIAAVNQSLALHSRGLVDAEPLERATHAGSLTSMNGARTTVSGLSTWPIASATAAARSLFVSLLPLLYVLAQQIAVPYFKAWLASVGLLTE